jgi:hypothetical protein
LIQDKGRYFKPTKSTSFAFLDILYLKWLRSKRVRFEHLAVVAYILLVASAKDPSSILGFVYKCLNSSLIQISHLRYTEDDRSMDMVQIGV